MKSEYHLNIPEAVYTRFNNHSLEIRDIIEYLDEFKDVPLASFCDYRVVAIIKCFKQDVFFDIIKKHGKLIEFIVDNGDVYNLKYYLNEENNTLDNFTEAVKQFIVNDYIKTDHHFCQRINGNMIYNIPIWLSSMNFHFIDDIHNAEEFLNYKSNTIILNPSYQNVISTLGIDNIRKFNEETGFFSHKSESYSSGLEMLNTFASYIMYYHPRRNYTSESWIIDFHHGTLPYDKFKEELARCLDYMRFVSIFEDYPNYDFLEGSFREEHPEIFIAKDAPDDLRKLFYQSNITPMYLSKHPEQIRYLTDKNLSHTINANIRLQQIDEHNHVVITDFISEYSTRYGNEALLELLARFGEVLGNITIAGLDNELFDKALIEEKIMESIYKQIIYTNISYDSLVKDQIFVNKYPDIFLTLEELENIPHKETIMSTFYNRALKFEDIRINPQLIPILKSKNLKHAFGIYQIANTNMQEFVFGVQFLETINNEQFLELCHRYGRYMTEYEDILSRIVIIRDNKIYYRKSNLEVSFDGLADIIEDGIYHKILANTCAYDENAPAFLLKKYPELFLDKEAPEDLKKYFYQKSSSLDFRKIKDHPGWVPYLNNPSLKTALLRGEGYSMNQYFDIFDYQKALKFGVNKAETIMAMINRNEVPLMKAWYDKTGKRFIPDYVIMHNIPLEEADKFLTAGHIWSNLMKNKSFAANITSRGAMLKLAYSFGAFDGDVRGTKKIMELLNIPPRKIALDKDYQSLLEKDIDNYINGVIYGEKTQDQHNPLTESSVYNLMNAMESESIPINTQKGIFKTLYRKTSAGYYVLAIDEQKCPQTAIAIRNILNEFDQLPIITPNKATRYFNHFVMEYNPEFWEMFVTNFDTIISNSEYLGRIAEIQKRFSEIKSIYRNVPITLELVFNYIRNNQYKNVNTGNQELSRVIGIPFPRYSEEDFHILQQIYNYGKQRVVSSIPKVAGKVGEYVYEMLDLTDPRALIIGYLTDCCQKLGHVGESCMEHSMTDKNGRLFVIRDKNDPYGIIAQSWVWRNKDVICFDNIEVPDKQMWSHGIPRGKEEDGIRNKFTDYLLDIYRRAAQELMKADELMYHSLLESGQITHEQYEGLRLRKITTGLGHSNLKGSVKELKKDDSVLTRPLSHSAPAKLGSLYIDDSTRQYILDEHTRESSYEGNTIAPYCDQYMSYDDSDFTEDGLHHLGRLAVVTDENERRFIDSKYTFVDKKHLVSEIANNCGLNPNTAKIIMHPNFAIVYDTHKSEIRLGSLLYNTKIDNQEQQIDIEKPVLMQMYVAIMGISSGKTINITLLNDREKAMYEKIININEELDKERGVHRGK